VSVGIARPRVPVRKLNDGRHRAECAHCDWTLTSTSSTRAESELYVAAHRHGHCLGTIPDTRRAR